MLFNILFIQPKQDKSVKRTATVQNCPNALKKFFFKGTGIPVMTVSNVFVNLLNPVSSVLFIIFPFVM